MAGRLSLCIIYLFILLICKASLQVTVVGFTGDSIVLPCSSSNNDLKREEITVYWRHNSSRNVYNIINGKDSIEGQNTAYKNRVETFPEEYVKGNFSLKLNNLQYTDGGKYICYITKALQNPTVELLIKVVFVFQANKQETRETMQRKQDQNGLCLFSFLFSLFIFCYVCESHEISTG
ncbi:CD276 antigen homolog isoform X2 [Myxocyprinus asiaticus]|uniref:CD276 antigen homolog isoform X2 n=1 Tax=Myxocyprinus asiaticus TaxID=70543 RepID=UPI002223C70D|nr:CD276 antigen homolog isoform X2 [Myxocyprinus asiaticus]